MEQIFQIRTLEVDPAITYLKLLLNKPNPVL